jgi:hypothetical protein
LSVRHIKISLTRTVHYCAQCSQILPAKRYYLVVPHVKAWRNRGSRYLHKEGVVTYRCYECGMKLLSGLLVNLEKKGDPERYLLDDLLGVGYSYEDSAHR